MRNKSCGNGSKNCVAFRNVMRNGIAIGNPNLNQAFLDDKDKDDVYIEPRVSWR